MKEKQESCFFIQILHSIKRNQETTDNKPNKFPFFTNSIQYEPTANLDETKTQHTSIPPIMPFFLSVFESLDQSSQMHLIKIHSNRLQNHHTK